MKGDAEHAKSQTPLSSEQRQSSSDESNREEDFGCIPLGIFEFKILPRMSVKTLMACRCLCRSLSSTIRSDRFAETHLAQSSTRPSLLITFRNREYTQRHIFSVPFPGKRNSVSTASFNLTVPVRTIHCVSESINGLIYVRGTICNPSTRQFITLPPSESRPLEVYDFHRNYFGYDPISKEYKILKLGMSLAPEDDARRMLNSVFTLESNSNSWRRIEDEPVLHFPATEGVCINGILYYGAVIDRVMPPDLNKILVAFDLNLERFERYKFPVPIPFDSNTLLTNLGGRPGLLSYTDGNQINVLALEDNGRLYWSLRTMVLPPYWEEFVGHLDYFIAGMIRTGELVLVPREFSIRFFLVLYHPEKNVMRRFRINGLDGFPALMIVTQRDLTVTEHVENIMFLQGFGRHRRR